MALSPKKRILNEETTTDDEILIGSITARHLGKSQGVVIQFVFDLPLTLAVPPFGTFGLGAVISLSAAACNVFVSPTGIPCAVPPTGIPCAVSPTGIPCAVSPTGIPCAVPRRAKKKVVTTDTTDSDECTDG